MFFTPEVLQKRDSGFGLLWLAATLGPQSVFRKLPKRSVVSADITELCDQIVEPAEPLALRLSSNLMIGVVRVYKVKQDILMNDVTACTNSLKKMAHDIVSPMHLQMAQSNLKESALSIVAHPSQAFALEFDNMVANWDDYLNIMEKGSEDQDDYEDPLRAKQKKKGKTRPPPSTEMPRADAHTLPPSHEDTFSMSMDFPMDPSSSQQDLSFHPDMEPFPIGDLDLVLPPDWITATNVNDDNVDPFADPQNQAADGLGDVDYNAAPMEIDSLDQPFADISPEMDANEYGLDNGEEHTSSNKRKQPDDADMDAASRGAEHEDQAGGAGQLDTADAFSREFLTQDQPDAVAQNKVVAEKEPRKAKKPRLILDARIELTDEELKASRAEYIKQQRLRRRQMTHKRTEKEDAQILDHLLWTVPLGIQATTLVDFWRSHLKLQVESRTGKLADTAVRSEKEGNAQRRPKRTPDGTPQALHDQAPFQPGPYEDQVGVDMDFFANDNPPEEVPFEMENRRDPSILRSSEEPEQARRASRPASSVGSQTRFKPQNQDRDLSSAGTQRSALLPWDYAAPSSATNNDPFDDGSASYRLRESPAHRRSSINPSYLSSATGLSPGAKGPSRMIDEDFAFNITHADEQQTLEDTQQSNQYSAALEKNSHNFLEYAKMQQQSLQASSTGATGLPFDTVAPKLTCTRQVAAAAFYHCLALATKDLLRVEQPVPHGPITLHIF
ncbi:Rec8 like protein-domain-containing protein [Pterulicium gracile]|uniref:Rec8 like protein-domain-containing protein n=1 Tax=Pterulicium gracile TaxID=1884261 RepID=A0A5C3QW38_9AGAR|nr:Rec8 like protein-domain-containing protein [Pterula gracilis]